MSTAREKMHRDLLLVMFKKKQKKQLKQLPALMEKCWWCSSHSNLCRGRFLKAFWLVEARNRAWATEVAARTRREGRARLTLCFFVLRIYLGFTANWSVFFRAWAACSAHFLVTQGGAAAVSPPQVWAFQGNGLMQASCDAPLTFSCGDIWLVLPFALHQLTCSVAGSSCHAFSISSACLPSAAPTWAPTRSSLTHLIS